MLFIEISACMAANLEELNKQVSGQLALISAETVRLLVWNREHIYNLVEAETNIPLAGSQDSH